MTNTNSASLSLRSLFLRYVAQTSPAPPMLDVSHAEGIYIYDQNGKPYIDFISGIAVSNTGHRHPKVIEAIRAQSEKYLHVMVYGEFIQGPQVQLAQKIATLLPEPLQSVYFVNSGTEAAEGALKLAKRATGRSKMLAFHNAYHGSTHGALSVMGSDYFKQGYGPLLPDVGFMQYNDFASLDAIDGETACVIVETIQGEAGAKVPDAAWIQALSKRCKEMGALLILDEIQSGFGRTGKLFAFEHFGIVPDILLMAKGMGGGIPIGAFVASNELMSKLSHDPVLGHITTFGGNALACAASLASLNAIIDEKLIDEVEAKEALIRENLKHPSILRIHGQGLMLAAELSDNHVVLKTMEACYRRGLITDWFLFADHCLRIAPPLVITNEQLVEACTIIKDAISEVVG
ncbi:MAG: aspartate aminotransferase family protein [Bacteroidia bacterium]